jgi:hypothetical protein
MQVLFHVGKMGIKCKVADVEMKRLMQALATSSK